MDRAKLIEKLHEFDRWAEALVAHVAERTRVVREEVSNALEALEALEKKVLEPAAAPDEPSAPVPGVSTPWNTGTRLPVAEETPAAPVEQPEEPIGRLEHVARAAAKASSVSDNGATTENSQQNHTAEPDSGKAASGV